MHLQIGNYYRPISVALVLFRNHSIWIIYYNFYTTVFRKMVVICSNYIHKIKCSGVKKSISIGLVQIPCKFMQSLSLKHRKTWYLYFQASKPSLVLCPLKTPSPFKWFLRQNDSSSTPMMSNAKIMTFSPLFCFNESSYTV